jgi:hypothetical protein
MRKAKRGIEVFMSSVGIERACPCSAAGRFLPVSK